MGNGPHRHRSLWLEEALCGSADLPPLRGLGRADVGILGGGYVGLWTAIRVKQHVPSCRVTVLEQDICGGGASGRNGGFVLAWWPKLASLARLFGEAEAVRIGRSSADAIGEIGAFCVEQGIDADFRRGGWLWTATTRAQMDAWNEVVKICERMGVAVFERLRPEEVAIRTGSSVHRAGVLEPRAAVVQPASLVRGLRAVALRLGVTIHEHTRVRGFTRGRPPVVTTDKGKLTADRLVIATNAWAAGIRELHRSLVVISSDMVASAPVPDRLERIGWGRDLSITDSQTMVDYYRLSQDGRVVYGKGGWTLALGGRIGASFDRHPRRAAEVTADFRRTYPSLSDVPVTHDWSGPIDRTQDSLPLIGHLGGREQIVYGVGWSGNGIGPSVLGGRILASLALGLRDEWGCHPLVDRTGGKFPPEPIRFIGAHVVREAVRRKERAELEDRRPSRIASWLAGLAPSGLEDKEK